MVFEIKTITAFVIKDDNDEEGVMGMELDGTFMPFVVADEARLKSIFPIAKMLSNKVNKPYRILQFSQRSDVTEELNTKYL